MHSALERESAWVLPDDSKEVHLTLVKNIRHNPESSADTEG